jgi:hypothetical protein
MVNMNKLPGLLKMYACIQREIGESYEMGVQATLYRPQIINFRHDSRKQL